MASEMKPPFDEVGIFLLCLNKTSSKDLRSLPMVKLGVWKGVGTLPKNEPVGIQKPPIEKVVRVVMSGRWMDGNQTNLQHLRKQRDLDLQA